MKIALLLLSVGLMVFQCKNKPSSNSGDAIAQKESVTPPDVAPPKVNPDDCIILAVVIDSSETSTALLIKDIKDVGFGFKQSIIVGDTIWVANKLDATDSLFVINYVSGLGGGKYSAIKLQKK